MSNRSCKSNDILRAAWIRLGSESESKIETSPSESNTSTPAGM